MSITRSNHTNDLSSAWRARYYAETTDPGGTAYRVEFIDNDTSAPGASEFNLASTPLEPHEIPMIDGSLTLTYDGETDHIAAPFVPSSLEVTWALQTSDHERLISAIESAEDGRFGLALYKVNTAGTAWEPFWVGILNAEASEWNLADNPFEFTLSASCGLQRLSEIDYLNSSSERYTGFSTLIEIIRNCLSKVPTFSFWLSSDVFFNEVADLINLEAHFDVATFLSGGGDLTATGTWPTTYSAGDEYPDSVMERTLVSEAVWYEDVEVETDRYNRRIYRSTDQPKCMDVLESVARTFGLRLFLTDGAFWALPPNAYNWSHQLNSKQYTKSVFDGATIRMPSGSESSTTLLVDHEIDLEVDHVLVDGLTQSYMLPQKATAIDFENAGRRSVFGASITEYLGDDRGLLIDRAEPGSVVGADQPMLLKFNYQCLPGTLLSTPPTDDAAAEAAGTDRIGAHVVIRVKLKLGAYWLVSEHGVSSTVTNTINLTDVPALGTSLTAKLVTLPEEITWSTSEGFCDFIVPWGSTTSTTPFGTQFTDDDGNVHYSGLHTFLDGFTAFEFDAIFSQTQHAYLNTELQLPSFPEGISSLEGAEIEVSRIVVTYDGTELTTFTELSNVFNTVASDLYASGTQEVHLDRISNLRLTVGEDSEGSTLTTTASCGENIETLDLGSTLIGDNHVDQVPSSNGALRVFYDDLSDLSDLGHYAGEYWQSLTEFADTTSDAVGTVHAVLTREQLYSRCEALRIQRGQISQEWDPSAAVDPIQFTSVLAHNCSTAADEVEYFALLSLGWNISAGLYDVEMYRLKRVITGTYVPDEDTSGGGGSGGGGGGGSWPTDDEVVLVRAERDPRQFDPVREAVSRFTRAIPPDYESNPGLRMQSYNTTDQKAKAGEGVILRAANDQGNQYELIMPSSDTPTIGQLMEVVSVSAGVITLDWHFPGMLPDTIIGTTHVLVASNSGKLLNCTNSSGCQITIPPESSVNFRQGTLISIMQNSATQVTIVAGLGVTLNNSDGTKTAKQYATITLHKYGADTWVVWGNTTT